MTLKEGLVSENTSSYHTAARQDWWGVGVWVRGESVGDEGTHEERSVTHELKLFSR